MSRGLGNGHLQAGSRGTREVVDLPARVTDEVVVVLLHDQTETALPRAERELADHPFSHQDPQGPINSRKADTGLPPAELLVDPVDRRVGGVPTEEREDGVTVEAGSRHGPCIPFPAVLITISTIVSAMKGRSGLDCPE
jgi:hypothetical protein